jgi:hypothetical protein
MNQVQVYANCIALALDLVRIYIKASGLPDLPFQFRADSMTDIQSQKKIFQILLEQIVMLHSHVVTPFDKSELIHRLLMSALQQPPEVRENLSRLAKQHVSVQEAFQRSLEVQWDANTFDSIQATRLETPGPQEAGGMEGMSVLTQLPGARFEENGENEIVFNEVTQTFTALPSLTWDQYTVIVQKLEEQGLESLSSLEKISVLLAIDRVAQREAN